MESPGYLGYDPNVLAFFLDLCEDDNKVAGSDGLLHPPNQACQVEYAGSAMGSEVLMGTSSGGSL